MLSIREILDSNLVSETSSVRVPPGKCQGNISVLKYDAVYFDSYEGFFWGGGSVVSILYHEDFEG